MNLALITQDFPPEIGGIETYATELAMRFSQQCEHFFVVAPDKRGTHRVDQSLPYPVYRVMAPNPFLGPGAMFESPLLFRKHQTRNAFHTQWQTLPASVFAQMNGQVDNIFVAAHARELLFNPFYGISGLQQWYEWYKRWMLARVDLFFPVSDYTAALLIKHGVNDERIKVVINGTDPDKFYPKDKHVSRKSIGITAQKVLLTITRLVSRKGVDTTLKAFKSVLDTYPDSCYLIVGDGAHKNQLQQLAEQLGIIDSVKFVGRVPHEQLIDYYNACDVFVMPSKTDIPNVEGFGIVFLEANACGKPVIGSYSGGIPSAVVNGKTGILVNEHDYQSLSQAIRRLFSDDELAEKMGRCGRRRVLEKANWDITARNLLEQIKNKI